MTRANSESAAHVPESISGALVEFKDVTFGYDVKKAPIVVNVSFQIKRGEVVTLLGPSGCGKSTCLNMVAGLLKPWSGTVAFEGQPINGINTSVGYMTQDDTLLPWRNVRSNIGLALRLKKAPRKGIEERVDHYLKMMNLTKAARQFPAQLSGGMKRRALLARSVITEPALALMDEPFAAIDADLREELQVELRRTTSELHQTVMFVTHDIPEAALVSDRVIVFAGAGTARIHGIVDVPFGAKRDLEELRVSEEYFSVQRELREHLRSGAANCGNTGEGGLA